MNPKALKKDMTVYDLAFLMMQGFDSVNKRFDGMEEKWDRRMSINEDRVRIIKNVIEKDLKTKVAW
jgi:hypothetical protein